MLENIDNKATRGSISQIILKALSLGDKYGYEICKDIERLSSGRLILKQPSLYSCLRRMEEQKLITSYWKDSSLGGRRHYYSITDKGKELYEENKSIWKTDEELLNSLPDSDIEVHKEELKQESPTPATNNIQINENKFFVVDQENLFNLARKKEPEIKKINDSAVEDEKHKSFLQFDFFEQNIKVVKKNPVVNKEDIQVYTNKFSSMDNHSQNIEPEDDIKEKTNDNSSAVSLAAIIGGEIKRDDVILNKGSDLSPVTSETEDKKSTDNLSGGSIFAYMKNASNNNESVDNEEPSLVEESLQEVNVIDKDESLSNVEPTEPNNKNLTSYITWDKAESGDAPLFDQDYKSAIGRLYNNSQLKDPYEQNKFHSFKEIFPSTTLIEKEESSEPKPNKIDAVIQSSSSSNIDCDDIVMLNNLYNLQGLNIKTHNNNENKKQNKIYRDKNKLNMLCVWLIAIIGLIEIFAVYAILNSNNLFLQSQKFVYICSVALLIIVGLAFSIKDIFDRYKLVIISRNNLKSFVVSLLLFILFVVAIFAVNMLFGMGSLSQVEYLSYWLVPCVVCSNILLAQGLYTLLLKMKVFNS